MSIQSLTVICLCITKIFALQFGFTVRDGENSLNGRFAAFGIIPDETSSKIKAEIVDQLTSYVNEELYRRKFEGIDRESFVVSDPTMLSALQDGRVLIGLKGELSVFLNIFRFSCKKIMPIQDIWKEAVFFADPIMTLNFDEINNFMKEFEVAMIEPSFAEEDESIYSDIFRRFTSSNISESEEAALLQKELDPPKKCCCGSCCNIM